jgi:AcrR family transcriptional regulator
MRPKNADSEETWNKIVDAARLALVVDASEGVTVSLRQVATAANVSLGTIHYYFETKEMLLEACLDAYYEALAKLTSELAELASRATRDDARKTIEEAVRRIYRFALSERPRLKLRASTNAVRGSLHPAREEHVRRPYLDWLTPVVRRLTDVSEIEVRMAIQTMSFAVMHYALLGDAELEQIAGMSGEEGVQVVEDHLIRASLRLLRITE